jgi:hypothetical protein
VTALTFHPTTHLLPEIRPAPVQRAWMDATPESFSYRCLPLNIANAYGWEILSPMAFEAYWRGGAHTSDIQITPLDNEPMMAVSHFGSGVLTFHVGYLIRTAPGFDLWIGGPINRPNDCIAALTGIMETDWAPYSFTMNWLFTRPNQLVRFEKGEPICHIFPVERGRLDKVDPAIVPMEQDPELKAEHDAWHKLRQTFLEDLPTAGSDAQRQKWQKHYFRGVRPDGSDGHPDHRTKMALKCPVQRG